MTVYTLFGQPALGLTVISDASQYTFGMQFSLSSNASLTGIWFYSGTAASQVPNACAIYAVTGQVLVASAAPATWSGAAGSGWVKCTFPGSTTLLASTNYKVVAQALADVGDGNWYSASIHYWDSGAGAGGLTNGPITAPNNAGGDGGQGTFVTPSPALAYPSSSFNADNYWVDVEVTTGSPPPPSVPSVLYSMRSFP
jgi:hypothetical protein